MIHSTRIVFAGGGTGGHLFPGLAVAEELRRSFDVRQITFVGSRPGFERKHVVEGGFEYFAAPSHRRPKSPAESVRFVWNNLAGYREARRLLKREGAAAVVGLGGASSFPTVRAAVSLGIPVVLLEQNVWPGRATRWLAPNASAVCLAFDEARFALRTASPVQVTGNPLRAGFADLLRAPPTVQAPRRRLLVLGGSGGAAALNEHVPKALYAFREQLANCEIVHQTGPQAEQPTRDLYRKLGLNAQVIDFSPDMPAILHNADLAICRAGGTTLAELAAAGVPALLVPLPQSAEQHQARNAALWQQLGCGVVVNQSPDGAQFERSLREAFERLIASRERRDEMSASARSQARGDAAWHVGRVIAELALRRTYRSAA